MIHVNRQTNNRCTCGFLQAVVVTMAGLPVGMVYAQPATVCAGGETFSESAPLGIEIVMPEVEPSVVSGVTVDLHVLHGWSGDVKITLSHADQSVTIVDRPGTSNVSSDCPCGCGFADITGTFFDGAAGDADRCVPGDSGVDEAHGPYAPIGPGQFLDFVGTSLDGAWMFTFTDHATDESGSIPLSGVCLQIEYAADCNGNGQPDEDDITSGASIDVDGFGVPDECQSLGDYDGSGAIDLTDLAALVECLSGPAGQPDPTPPVNAPACLQFFDTDRDADVDATDAAAFLTLYGSGL